MSLIELMTPKDAFWLFSAVGALLGLLIGFLSGFVVLFGFTLSTSTHTSHEIFLGILAMFGILVISVVVMAFLGGAIGVLWHWLARKVTPTQQHEVSRVLAR